jgi:ArsR family transcriptional regulator
VSSAVDSEIVSDKTKKLLKALSEPLRLQIIEALSSGEKCVCDLIEEMGLAQSKISFHLKVLKEAELIIDRHSGRWVYYHLNIEALNSLQDWIVLLKENSQGSTKDCC